MLLGRYRKLVAAHSEYQFVGSGRSWIATRGKKFADTKGESEAVN